MRRTRVEGLREVDRLAAEVQRQGIGNDHRPWRRCGRDRSDAGAATTPATGRHNHSTGLESLMGPQAWHCLLEMRSPMDPPSTWGYGLSPESRANVEASFENMTVPEKQVMVVELLRVISAILSEVAQAYTNSMATSRETRARTGHDHEGDQEGEGDENSLVQGLPPHKVRRLEEASKQKPVNVILGTAYEQATRSLMTALERMSAEDARKCSQVLLRNLLAKYGTEGTRGLPLEAEALLSGLVTFGAELSVDHASLNAMDSYFVDNWWSVLGPVLPPDLDQGQMENAAGAGSGATSSTDPIAVHSLRDNPEMSEKVRDARRDGPATTLLTVKEEPVDKPKWQDIPKGVRYVELEDSFTKELGEEGDLPRTQPDHELGERSEGEPEDEETASVETPEPNDTTLTRSAVPLDEGGKPVETAEVADVQAAEETPRQGGTVGGGEEVSFRRAMFQECERLRAAQYRQWEREVMDEALLEPARQEGLHLVVRGGVRRQAGHQGTTQTIMFRIQPGETLDLRIAAPERDVSRRRQGREGTDEPEV